jgi:hypothetical protein
VEEEGYNYPKRDEEEEEVKEYKMRTIFLDAYCYSYL